MRELCKYRNKLYKKPTRAESVFRSKLKTLNIPFYFQKQFKNDKFRCIVDFYIPVKRIVIELDGGYHNSKAQTNKDKYRDYWLSKEKRCRVIRISNEKALALSGKQIKELVYVI